MTRVYLFENNIIVSDEIMCVNDEMRALFFLFYVLLRILTLSQQAMYGLEIDTFDCFLRLSVCRLVLCISIKAPQPQCSVLRPATRRHMPRPASTPLRSGISLTNRLVAVGTYQNITSILALSLQAYYQAKGQRPKLKFEKVRPKAKGQNPILNKKGLSPTGQNASYSRMPSLDHSWPYCPYVCQIDFHFSWLT